MKQCTIKPTTENNTKYNYKSVYYQNYKLNIYLLSRCCGYTLPVKRLEALIPYYFYLHSRIRTIINIIINHNQPVRMCAVNTLAAFYSASSPIHLKTNTFFGLSRNVLFTSSIHIVVNTQKIISSLI